MVDVTTIQAGTAFAWFMLMMVLRRVVLLGLFIALRRGKPNLPGTRVPEDDLLAAKAVNPTTIGPVPVQFTKDVRVNKAITNDSENDTYFLVLLLATAAFSDTSLGNGSVTRTIVYGVIYLSARILHSIAYIMALQPWRTLCFGIGLTCTVACSLDLVITMSRRSN